MALAVRVIPRAKRTEIAGRRGDALLVRLAAPPVDGAANEALLAFLSDRLGVPRRRISLVRGAASRDKLVDIEGMSAADAVRRLAPDDALTG
jgi:uncharacterized protein (TIGR00251 family)